MRLALAVAALALTAAVALAADSAEPNALGFSRDGRNFAFEQHGIQDGSGFAYSEIFIIDLATDSWLPGTPIRKRADAEETPLGDIRAAAMREAGPILTARGIEGPVQILALNPATEVVADRRRMVFDRAYWSGADPGDASEIRHVLTMTEIDLATPAGCPTDMGGPYRGFALEIVQTRSGAQRELHRDSGLPASRGCAMAYDIAAVFAPGQYVDAPYFVALIGVYTLGFEGLDRRFIAVPMELP
jgi:predicted secreted protein